MQALQISLEEIKQALDKRDFKRLRSVFKHIDAPDIAEALSQFDIVDSIVLYRLVPKSRRTDVFSYLNFERQEEMLDRLPDEVVITLINEMEADDRTQLFEQLPEPIVNRLLTRLSPKERKIAKKLLSYPEDSVGRLMSPEFIALKSGVTVKDAIETIRWKAGELSESNLHHLFVINDQGEYLGHISLSALILADPPTLTIDSIMDATQQPLKANEDQSTAVDFFRKYDRPYIPVVDNNYLLVGVVEADDVFDVAEEEATEDIQQFGGQAILEDSYFQTSIPVMIKKRGGWLAVIFFASMLTANALEHFNDTIQAMTVLVFFLPLIIASGGNSGSQAASLMIRGLAVKEVDIKDWSRVLGREIVIGLGLGALLGVLGFLRAIAGGQDQLIGVIISASLIGVIVFGSIAGSMLPFLLKASKLDPAVSSSPVISSLVDLVGIIIFFNIALMIIRHFGIG